MKIDEIQSLIRFVAKSGVSEIELEMTDFSIKIKNSSPVHEIRIAPPHETVTRIMPIIQTPVISVQTETISSGKKIEQVADKSKYITVKSPMIGTFYTTSGPQKPPFVNVGDEVKQGQTLCIIEAMKLFNEIESEVSGKIIKILIDDATPVEYDSELFLIEPS